MAQDAEKLAAQSTRLRELKGLARGLTFKKIAEATGVTERQVQRWFSGQSELSGTNLTALAEFLGTTPDYIEYGVVKRLRPDTETPDLIGELERGALADQLREINTRLNQLQAVLEALAEPNVVSDALQALDQGAPRRRATDRRQAA